MSEISEELKEKLLLNFSDEILKKFKELCRDIPETSEGRKAIIEITSMVACDFLASTALFLLKLSGAEKKDEIISNLNDLVEIYLEDKLEQCGK